MERPLTTIVDSITGGQVTRPYNDEEFTAYQNAEVERLKLLVPASITPRQCRLILAQQGLLASVEQTISGMDEATRITWEYALEFRRDDPLLNALGVNLGLTPEQIDAFFIAAAQL